MIRSGIILLVEDNKDDVDLTIRAFEKNHIVNQIVVARDGEEALDYLFASGAHRGRNPQAQPDVVLHDLKLPKVDGLEVLRRMRADTRTRRVPVVVLTSSREATDVVTSYDSGANSFIRKPVDFDAFSETVRQLGLYWLVTNESPPAV